MSEKQAMQVGRVALETASAELELLQNMRNSREVTEDAGDQPGYQHSFSATAGDKQLTKQAAWSKA